jgi:hypothetical protein
MHWQTCIFWAKLTPFSLQLLVTDRSNFRLVYVDLAGGFKSEPGLSRGTHKLHAGP